MGWLLFLHDQRQCLGHCAIQKAHSMPQKKRPSGTGALRLRFQQGFLVRKPTAPRNQVF